ncbi:MAG: tetratricopeptide repeat protein, partial [Candidatus Riflebacteria bacterium]|nr:tetratricopeptide repeat protein [Candidatus Riflebacteria bacterium]
TQERICRELGALDELGSALDNQAQILRERGKYDEALALLKEAEKNFRKGCYRAGLAQTLVNMALLLVFDLKRPADALPIAREACELVDKESIDDVPRETMRLLLDFIHSSTSAK